MNSKTRLQVVEGSGRSGDIRNELTGFPQLLHERRPLSPRQAELRVAAFVAALIAAVITFALVSK